MNEPSSIFDMVGPIMIGPSSSHTAGVVRIGNAGNKVLGEVPKLAEITFYNSFARTYEGHGSDRAILAGLLGYKTDDERIRESFDFASKEGLGYLFKSAGSNSTMHPNTVRLSLESKDGAVATLVGESLGGGVINISSVNGFRANVGLKLPTVIIEAEDRPGKIAFIASVLANDDVNIASMSVSRRGKNDLACHFIEMDTALPEITISYLTHLSWVKKITTLPKIE